jgi:hypothetical protein
MRGRVYTRMLAIKDFKQQHKDLLTRDYHQRDYPAIHLAWVTFTEQLHRDGRISSVQRSTWTSPKFCFKPNKRHT